VIPQPLFLIVILIKRTRSWWFAIVFRFVVIMLRVRGLCTGLGYCFFVPEALELFRFLPSAPIAFCDVSVPRFEKENVGCHDQSLDPTPNSD
jgi:hypothetical protein